MSLPSFHGESNSSSSRRRRHCWRRRRYHTHRSLRAQKHEPRRIEPTRGELYIRQRLDAAGVRHRPEANARGHVRENLRHTGRMSRHSDYAQRLRRATTR